GGAGERGRGGRRGVLEGREGGEELSGRAAEAGAAHAALVERAGALTLEVQRLEEAATELEQRAAALGLELAESRGRVDELRTAIAAGEAQLDVDVRELDALRQT